MVMITKFRLFENNGKYQEISEEDFLKILNENCKNFSFDNDPLYRGDMKDFQFMLHNPEERNTRGITYVDFFKEKENDTDKYPVVRKNSSMGVGGGDIKEMKRVATMLGDLDGSPVYKVIPFDNSKMVFCPVFDLAVLDMFHDVDSVQDDNFIMVEYTKGFKVPVSELKDIQKSIMGTNQYASKGFEFFTSSPCLLINIENEDFLK
jgi:hypothetical protein